MLCRQRLLGRRDDPENLGEFIQRHVPKVQVHLAQLELLAEMAELVSKATLMEIIGFMQVAVAQVGISHQPAAMAD